MSEQKDGVPRETKKGALARLLSSLKLLVDPELPVQDRRAAGRIDCAFDLSYLTETGVSGTGQVLDVSRRGLRMRSPVQISKGITVALKPPASLSEGNYAPVVARVMRSTRSGGSFLSGLLLPPGVEDEETWLEALLVSMGYAPEYGQRRKLVRAESSIPGQALFDACPPADVTVMNLSLGGALLKSELIFDKQASFRLQLGPFSDLPELELGGTVLRHTPTEGKDRHLHSVRFGPLEERRHSLLKEYILKHRFARFPWLWLSSGGLLTRPALADGPSNGWEELPRPPVDKGLMMEPKLAGFGPRLHLIWIGTSPDVPKPEVFHASLSGGSTTWSSPRAPFFGMNKSRVRRAEMDECSDGELNVNRP